MVTRDISFNSPEENIVFDEVLLSLAEAGKGGEAVRFWESSRYFVVLGLTGKEEDDVRLDQVQKDNIPVLRRASGGGTVLQGPGCLNFSLILKKEKNPLLNDLRKSYQFILGRVMGALKELQMDVVFRPISDIALGQGERKFSGNAQKRGRKFILHHGTILYNFQLQLLEEYLAMPKDVPDYRKGRSHLDFVTNVSMDISRFKAILREHWGGQMTLNDITAEEKRHLAAFLADPKILNRLFSKS